MTFFRVLSAVLVSACWFVCVSVAQNANSANSTTTKPAASTTKTGTNNHNTTTKAPASTSRFAVDSFMIQRALYVMIGITVIGLLYFLIRTVRLKKPSQKKKYGLLSNYDDSVEMEAVDSDEDDTLYEARSLRR